MKYYFKINKNSIFKYLVKEILTLVIVFLIVILFNYNISNSKSLETYFFTFIFLGFIYLIPLFLIFFNHYYKSKNVILIFDKDLKEFTYFGNNEKIIFRVDEVYKVNLYLTPAGYKNSFDISYYQKYKYYKLILLNKKEVNISCLICDNLELFFTEEKIKRKKKFLPLIN
jgi:hypothetical protein